MARRMIGWASAPRAVRVSSGGDSMVPELPRVLIDTSSVPAITGATWTPTDAAGFQAALDGAALGDLITLAAGTTYSGNFTMPNKASGSGWITIRSSAHASLPAIGTRVGPANVANMPTIQSPNSSAALVCVFGSGVAAHHYWLQGLEITVAGGVSVIFNVIEFGSNQTTVADTPHHLTIDRCYVHGQTTGDVRRPLYLNSATTAIVDSYLSEGHSVDVDSQAICGINGPGPYKIVNNYLSAAGENVLFGGGDPSVAGQVPSDIEFRNNYCFKPLTWKIGDPSYAGTAWAVKNILELKNAQRMLIDGNIFENNWPHAQNGFSILFTVRNQDGGAPWCTVQDITFTNNILRGGYAGFNILGQDVRPELLGVYSQPMKRVVIRNNLITGIDVPNGTLVQITIGMDDLVIEHLTAPTVGYLCIFASPLDLQLNNRFICRNNILGYGQYGVAGDGKASGQSTLDYYFPGAVFDKNLLIGDMGGSPYPSVTYNETVESGVGFVSSGTGNYRLTSGSAYHLAGTDGLDLGANIDALPTG